MDSNNYLELTMKKLKKLLLTTIIGSGYCFRHLSWLIKNKGGQIFMKYFIFGVDQQVYEHIRNGAKVKVICENDFAKIIMNIYKVVATILDNPKFALKYTLDKMKRNIKRGL